MDLSDLSEQARVARQEFERWTRAQVLADRTIDPIALVKRALDHFGPDAKFVVSWVYASFQERIASVLSTQPGIFDCAIEDPAPASSLARIAPVRTEAERVAKHRETKDWRAWLATTKVPPRLKLMRRSDLLSLAETHKQEGLSNLKLAAAAQTILTRLPDESAAVGERWSDAELSALIQDIDERAAWMRAEPDVPALAERAG